ncbi:MAG: hypothetical protein K2X82_02915 [Gemmataceae bacterium]|nr:hypothetical protein [Gemmataceae bacterium]
MDRLGHFYRRLTDGAERRPGLVAAMLWPRRQANPDFADLYPRVSHWLVEVDQGRVVREVGLAALVGAAGGSTPIVLGPWDRNPGLWTGFELPIGREDEIDAAGFEAAWDRLAVYLAERDGS